MTCNFLLICLIFVGPSYLHGSHEIPEKGLWNIFTYNLLPVNMIKYRTLSVDWFQILHTTFHCTASGANLPTWLLDSLFWLNWWFYIFLLLGATRGIWMSSVKLAPIWKKNRSGFYKHSFTLWINNYRYIALVRFLFGIVHNFKPRFVYRRWVTLSLVLNL